MFVIHFYIMGIQQQAKVVLAKLFRTYWVEPVDKLETLRKMPHVVLRCEDGVRVKLHKRGIS